MLVNSFRRSAESKVLVFPSETLVAAARVTNFRRELDMQDIEECPIRGTNIHYFRRTA